MTIEGYYVGRLGARYIFLTKRGLRTYYIARNGQEKMAQIPVGLMTRVTYGTPKYTKVEVDKTNKLSAYRLGKAILNQNAVPL